MEPSHLGSSAERPAVTVLVPVFGAAEDLRRCLASLARSFSAQAALRLVLDGPQPPDVEQLLKEFCGRGGLTIDVLRLPTRQGFTAAANAGIAASTGDIVLLNSDTEVTEGWLDKLSEAAYGAPRVASVTPFSNSATLCSIPRRGENALPAGQTVDSFARLIEESSRRERPAIPTGVGFCMYLRREALDEVGLFDADSFGLGYGEEVDWCFRATRLGWRHVLDDATFVFHAGQASFGAQYGARVQRANRLIRRRYPELWRELADYLRRDPVAAARQRVIERLRPQPAASGPRPGRTLHLVHGWPPWNHAGTELYAARLSRWQAERRPTSALSRIEHPRRSLGDAIELFDHGVRVRLLVNNFTQRNPLSRSALWEPAFERAFMRLMTHERPDVVHIHHLAGLSARLPMLAKRHNVKLVYQVQDWWTLCARANLLDWQRRLCSGPGLRKCSRCLPLTGRLPWLANPLLHAWRRSLLRRALRSADAWIMGSRFIESSFRDFGLLRDADPVHVLPYGIDRPASQPRAPSPGAPLRVGFVGSLLPHKGAHVAVAAFSGIPARTATLDVWGNENASPAYSAELRALAVDSVRFRGSFPEGTEAAVFADLDVLVVPSLALESYGLAPREAMAHGLYVLASRRGALSESTADPRCGEGFDPENPAELRQRIVALAEDRGWQSRQSSCRDRWPTFDEHAEAVEDVYERVLATQRPRRA